MDFPALPDFSSSKHTVSVTESFKSDKKVSIHVEHTTMPPDPALDFPIPSVKHEEPAATVLGEQVESLETKVLLLEPTKMPPPVTEVLDESIQLEENIIEDSSITKKSALSFFKNIIKENEEEKKTTKPIEPLKKPCIPEPLPAIQSLPVFPPLSFENALPQPSVFSQTSIQETSQQFESISSSEGFFLQPEPPPEIGFIPKSQVTKTKEEMSSRVKKLEESHRNLSQEQIPSGGVRIFPTPIQRSSETISTQTSVQEQPYCEPPYVPKVESLIYQEKVVEQPTPDFCVKNAPIIEPFEPFKVAKFEPPQQFGSFKKEEFTESFNSFQSSSVETSLFNESSPVVSKPDSLGPILRPSAGVSTRPQSPRPSAEGVHMEKMWSTKTKEEYVPFPHSSPTKDIVTISQQPQETVKQFKSEKTSVIQESYRTSSPLPSTTGLAMEKLWTPSLDHQRPLSALSGGERPKSPSVQGLAMDKIWAHKSSTQKKVWPPPQPKEDNQVVPPWTLKAGDIAQQENTDQPETITQKQSVFEKTESQSQMLTNISKVETKNVSSSFIKSDSAFKEVTPTKPVQFNIPPPVIQPESKIIYVAEAQASHSTKMPLVQPQEFIETETTQFSNLSETMQRKETISNGTSIIEENVLKPSEAIKKWPPSNMFEKEESKVISSSTDFQSSFLKKEFTSKEIKSSMSSENGFNEAPLIPGPPPEMGFAEAPRRRQSYVETIEQNLEKNIDKEPSKHLAGAVRIIPPPPTQKKEVTSKLETQSQTTIQKESVQEKQPYVPECLTKPLPNLEPFPFKPDPPKSRPAKCPPPPRPSKFVKGSFTESDYESDCDAVRIGVKWNPWQSDSEESSFRKVKPPTTSVTKRPHSVSGHVVPPTEFEKPPPFQVTTKPAPPVTIQKTEVSKISNGKIEKTEETHQKIAISKEIKYVQNKSPILKPGSPPQFVEAPAPKHRPTTGKPGSPKTKPKSAQVAPLDGYAADTDEPPNQFKLSSKVEESSTVVKSEQIISYEQSRSEQKTVSSSSSRIGKKVRKCCA